MFTRKTSDQVGFSPAGVMDLRTLVQDTCGSLGSTVCELILQESETPEGLSRLLRRVRIKPPEAPEEQLRLLAEWVQENGEHALFRAVARKQEAEHYELKPMGSLDQRDHDRQVMESLLRKQRAKAQSAHPQAQQPFPQAQSPAVPSPPRNGGSGGGSQPPPLPIRRPSYTGRQYNSTIPLFKPYPKAKSLRGRPENPISGSFRDTRSCLPTRTYTPPPGYPWPWPPYLKPGPEPPPSYLPPNQLTWPYIDRRTGDDRRQENDRRHRLEVVYKNRRYGGDRRKTDRRKN